MVAALTPPSPKQSTQNPATTPSGTLTSRQHAPAVMTASQTAIRRCRRPPARTSGLTAAPIDAATAPADTATPSAGDDHDHCVAPTVSSVGSSAPAPRLYSASAA